MAKSVGKAPAESPRKQSRSATLVAWFSKRPVLFRIAVGLAAPLWVLVSFYGAQGLIYLIVLAMFTLNIPYDIMNDTVFEATISGTMYVIALAIAIGVPWLLWRRTLSKSELGFKETLPSWKDVGWAPLVFIGALLSTAFVLRLVGQLVPELNLETDQEVGFEMIAQRYELLLAYLTIAVVGPIAEEVLFRGFLHGTLRKKLSAWATVLITATLFAALHLGIYQLDEWQWNVAIDTFVLSLWLGFMRERTGTIWVPILVHVIKNSLAFFVLFVAPMLAIGAGV